MIQLAPDGFSISDNGPKHVLAWDSVKEIFALKLDMGTHDTIRLGFRTSDNGAYLEIDEDVVGFGELVVEIERRFQLLEKNWWTKVAFPAFAMNRTTLWGEPLIES